MASHLSVLALLLLCTACCSQAANFTQCYADIRDKLPLNRNGLPDFNGFIINASFPDPVYRGPIRGYRFNDVPEQRPLFLTLQGCINACGSDAELNTFVDAFSIMTTWVLPAIALLSQLPYESLSDKKIKNAEAFANWVGAPAAALTTTIWNILMIQKCRILSEFPPEPRTQSVLRDSLYILSAINQYQYPRTQAVAADRRRDLALLRGTLYPLVRDNENRLPDLLRKKLENMTTHLAFHLRLPRRKGVYPLWLNLVWFLLAFAFSIVTAFAQLGDNTTAHSLALGLLLSWMPIIVLAAVVDRNPVSATRCGILIERWLYNIDALFAEQDVYLRNQLLRTRSQESARRTETAPSVSSETLSEFHVEDAELSSNLDDENTSRTGSGSFRTRRQDTEQLIALQRLVPQIVNTEQWCKGAETSDFFIGEFIGQGRRMRYCAVADTILATITHSKRPFLELPGIDEAQNFRKQLPKRPAYWCLTWLTSQFLVGTGYATAFVVSFQTPTIGLGCRTLCYTVWYALSFFSWVFLGIWQEPPRYIRVFSWIPNAFASLSLFGIMLLQAAGGLNSCICKSSTFGGSQYGGYMDFENGEFYHRNFNVQLVWALATAFGSLSACAAIWWFWQRWSRDASLWKVNEASELEVVEGVHLEWLT